MDMNLIVLAGRLAAPPEIPAFESGTQLIRYLVTVRVAEPRRRVDVLPVTLWNPSPEQLQEEPQPGRRVAVTGAIQRRFWQAASGRRSQIEIVADQVCFKDEPDIEPFGVPGADEQNEEVRQD